MTIRGYEAKIDWNDIFPRSASKDFAGLMIGDRIGGGTARDVYALNFPPDGCESVVKFEDIALSFQNVIEWKIWGWVVETKWEKWFAPCHSIGGNGVVLIQRRTTALDRLPKRIPSFMVDTKKSNWGLYEGRPVCHDYGMMPPMPVKKIKMVKAKWRED